jgi:FKBP-type peptidyl-prolyl cis-trans isomerase SlpA
MKQSSMSEAMNLPIEPNTRITLNFSLVLDTGEEVDSNFGQDPVSFVMGDGSLLPGFERRLLGMRAGDEAEFRIPSEEGFGDPQDDNIQEIPRREFDEEAPLEPGMLFSFADAAGGEVPGMIAAVGEDSVTVDFNHPLSGRTIHFRVRIARVEPAELH